MYYETYGDEKGYPIVLIHPIGGNIKIWEHEILFIRKKSFRIIAYELRVTIGAIWVNARVLL